MKFTLGQRVRETHSGIDGRIDKIELSAYSEPKYRIQRDGVTADGELWGEVWFFESRLVA